MADLLSILSLKAFAAETGSKIVTAWAALFFAVVTWTSYARWNNFEYRTFDLAFYVQGIWQFIHGRFEVSVLHAPLLGNHVEPIVFLLAPFFALLRHPMVFVLAQNAALAAMGPIGYRMARREGFTQWPAGSLGVILLLTPATAYVALHEFHPEALAAPFLLLLFDARSRQSLGRHWIWFVAVLACKENMALLLAAYCAIHLLLERARGWRELRRWYFWPMLLALLWFVLCSKVITPALNSGSIDYLTLYDRLGQSGFEILGNALTRPQLIGHALLQSLSQGNLVWALLFPFLGLPLLRPRCLLISAPILLQHLLSWRSSEWTVYFHYAAPLIPLFWLAAVEAITPRRWQMKVVPWLMLAACLVAQFWLGPARAISDEALRYSSKSPEREGKNIFLSQIPPDASVVAPLPYLSHLAEREKLYSLHFILKGLKTLSHARYEPPPPTDYVLIDHGDAATFDIAAGYYHPAMQMKDGRVIPSSDALLEAFLARVPWESKTQGKLTLLRRVDGPLIKPGP